MLLLTGENGIITKAREAAFRKEMTEIRESLEMEFINYEMYGKTFEQVKIKDIEKFDDYLKQEIIFWGKYEEKITQDITNLTIDYIRENAIDIIGENTVEIGEEEYVNDLYYISKEAANGKKKKYIYDKSVNQIYKVPLTKIGPYKVHSIKELDYQKTHGTEGRRSLEKTVITQESQIEKVGSIAYYAPELKGFIEENTNAVYYKVNANGTIDATFETKPITTYLSSKERIIQKDNSEYEFYNYEKKIWANIKVDGSGVDTYWTWIPRYAYKIEGNETKIIYINTENKQALDGGDLPEGYTVHTAFIDNNKKGIWVSKYEMEEVATSIKGFSHYLPDMKGFDKNTTYIEVMNENGTFTETKLSNIKNLAEFSRENKWFDYENQIWANIKTKGYGIECWWVWIPRYAYKISANTTSVIFVDKNNKPLTGEELPEGYIVHPAFEDGKKGIWVSKYETEQEMGTENTVNVPDMSGFNKDTTWIEIYKDDGTFEEVKLSTINDLKQFAEQHRWYDYSKKIWANIKTISNGAECWWVWIPRYAYSILGNDTKVIFLDENGKPFDGIPLSAEYIEHPVFSENKKGIWVSKYEMSE